MNGKEITKLLRAKGHSVKKIAEGLGVKPPTVSQVIHQVRPNPRIRQFIAEAVNRPKHELWPEKGKKVQLEKTSIPWTQNGV